VLDRIARFFEPSVPDRADRANGVAVSDDHY
jgi:hypothetical protein